MTTPMNRWQGTSLSESSFAFAASYEIVTRLGGTAGLQAAPVVPSLQDEADLGFDLAVPGSWVTFYLQYKLARLLTTARAAEHYLFRAPYYRFYVKTDVTANGSCQHNVLLDLQRRLSGSTNLVYYAAPVFHEVPDLYHHMIAGTVTDNSVFAAPSQIGVVVPGSLHRYCFTSVHDVTGLSTPTEPTSGAFRALLEQLPRRQPPILLREHLRDQLSRFRGLDSADIGVYRTPGDLAAAAAALGLQPIVIKLSG